MNYKDQAAKVVIKTAIKSSLKLLNFLPVPFQVIRTGMELGATLLRARSDVEVTKISLGGVDTECLYLQNDHHIPESKYAVLHFHGGIFFAGSPQTHRGLGSEIAARSGATVYMLDYRLAPEHPYPAAFDDCLSAYQALLDKGYSSDQIILGGDSAGGALVLALLVALRDRNLALPAASVMICPMVDLTLSADSFEKNKWRDPMLTKSILQRGADAYRGNIQSADARVSPVLADLSGLPPMLIQIGSDEVLFDDSAQLAKHAERSGVKVEHHVYAGMWHNFQMFNTFFSPASDALDEIADFIKDYMH